MNSQVEQYFRQIDKAIVDNDPDRIMEAALHLSLAAHREPEYPDEWLDLLLEKLGKFKNNSQLGGQFLFDALLAVVEQLNDKQLQTLLDHLDENYGFYVEPSLSFLIAEWIGSLRNRRALAIIEKWVNHCTATEPLTNLKTAIYEFSDNPFLSYSAESMLVERARQLRAEVEKILKERSRETKGSD